MSPVNTNSGWQLLRVTLLAAQQEAVSELLTTAGASAITLEGPSDDPLFEPLPGEMPLWEQLSLIALFNRDHNLQPVQQLLALIGDVDHQLLEEQEWSRTWLKYWQPRSFGNCAEDKQLWVVPSWDQQERPGHRLLLDPGLAFGTGNHATTSLCLDWLAEHPPKGQKVIDYGCGSGVLGVAALCLGADQVLGVDIDPQALTATRNNAELNLVSTRMTTCGVDENTPSEFGGVNLLIANILYQPLTELAEDFAQMLVAGGDLVLSGLLILQADAIIEIYRPWFEMSDVSEVDGWIRVVGVRRDE
ncbi:MAG: 50S ribosomal protein L11 methyltransferase [Immundisolibacteraceae bacterium]|nr:50S ribosomal protein L11 methyltransferase [Immundisolibacteraceae bacterium]